MPDPVTPSAPAPAPAIETPAENHFSDITSYADSAAVIANNAAVDVQTTSKTLIYAVGAAFALLLAFHVLKKAHIL